MLHHATAYCGMSKNWLTLYTGFENVRSWLADVREHADPHLTCILVGNKVDLCSEPQSNSISSSPPKPSSRLNVTPSGPPKRQVTTEEGSLFAKQEGLLFVEASAKSGENVERAFEEAAQDILEKIKNGVFDDDRVSLIVIYAADTPHD